jgi:hypothetical protein
MIKFFLTVILGTVAIVATGWTVLFVWVFALGMGWIK